MIASALRSTELNPAKLAFLFKKQFELCKVKPDETVACVSDLGTRREYMRPPSPPPSRLAAMSTKCV